MLEEMMEALLTAEEDPSFCKPSMGGGMIMYMDGFRNTLHARHPCLNLFFPTWTLNSKGKFYWALVGVFLMSIAVEALSKLRRRVVLAARKAHQPTIGASSTTTTTETFWSPHVLRLVVTCLHGLQAWLGYMVMLATMTFSLELFWAVVLGLVVGYAFMFRHEEALGEHHVTSNPCCNFMQGEAEEVEGDYDDEDDDERDVVVAETENEERLRLRQEDEL